MKNKHGLTQELIFREAWDSDKEALKTTLVAADIAISMNFKEDSILCYSPSSTLGDGVFNVSGMHQICVFDTTSTVSVSPDESGETWYPLTLVPLTPVAICCKRVKVTGKAVVQA